jgi:hypothetical protein
VSAGGTVAVVDTLGVIEEFAAGTLAFVSCPPPHAAMARLAAQAMKTERMRGFDMFITPPENRRYGNEPSSSKKHEACPRMLMLAIFT